MSKKIRDFAPLAGIFVIGITQIIFFFLKVFGVVDWSWNAVFIPLDVGIAAIFLCAIIGTMREMRGSNG